LQDHFNTTKYDDEIYHNTTKWEKVISEGVNKANLFYDKYQNKINKEITNLENLSQIKSKELTGLNNNLIELKENQKEIENRIEGFESPIGKLTIGFNDLLIIFPFALLIGFILIVSYLIASMNIRRKLIKFYPNSVENNNVVNENDIADVAPLWIDPKNKEQNKFIRWLVLIFPLILFIMSFTLTKNNWFPYLSNYGIKENDIIISNVIFAFSLILFIYSYYKVYKEYNKK
jgi:hypothetical protein